MPHGKKKILYAFEFAHDDAMWNDVLEAAQRLAPGRVEAEGFGGIFRGYGPGASLRRIANMIWMHAAIPFKILASKPDLVFARTTPPMMQISCAFWARLLGAKSAVWLMDYHPVFGQRSSAGAAARAAWSLFSWLDRALLKTNTAVICLDRAMERTVLEREPQAKTRTVPTWGLEGAQWSDMGRPDGDSVRLIYSGNFGKAHSAGRLKKFLKALSARKKTVLCYCGNSAPAESAFREIASECGTGFESFPRVEKFSQLGELYREKEIDYGIVVLDDLFAGLVSPSKFSGYASFGLPIIDIGPRGTNSNMACSEMGAGIAVEDDEAAEAAAEAAADPKVQRKCAAATRAAAEHFSKDRAGDVAKILLGAAGCGDA